MKLLSAVTCVAALSSAAALAIPFKSEPKSDWLVPEGPAMRKTWPPPELGPLNENIVKPRPLEDEYGPRDLKALKSDWLVPEAPESPELPFKIEPKSDWLVPEAPFKKPPFPEALKSDWLPVRPQALKADCNKLRAKYGLVPECCLKFRGNGGRREAEVLASGEVRHARFGIQDCASWVLRHGGPQPGGACGYGYAYNENSEVCPSNNDAMCQSVCCKPLYYYTSAVRTGGGNGGRRGIEKFDLGRIKTRPCQEGQFFSFRVGKCLPYTPPPKLVPELPPKYPLEEGDVREEVDEMVIAQPHQWCPPNCWIPFVDICVC